MKSLHAACGALALAALCAPALAQTSSSTTTVQTAPSATVTTNVTSSTGIPVTSGTGVVVKPALPATHTMIPGGTLVQYETQTLGGPGTTTVVTRYWANVPAGVTNDMEFKRWMALR